MEIKLELPGLPPMANGSYGHWKKQWQIKKAWKRRIGQMLLDLVPSMPYKKVRVILTRHSSSEPDFDGLVHGFKPIVDALVEYGIVVDDSGKHMEREYRWEKAVAKQGKIRVEVFPIEE